MRWLILRLLPTLALAKDYGTATVIPFNNVYDVVNTNPARHITDGYTLCMRVR